MSILKLGCCDLDCSFSSWDLYNTWFSTTILGSDPTNCLRFYVTVKWIAFSRASNFYVYPEESKWQCRTPHSGLPRDFLQCLLRNFARELFGQIQVFEGNGKRKRRCFAIDRYGLPPRVHGLFGQRMVARRRVTPESGLEIEWRRLKTVPLPRDHPSVFWVWVWEKKQSLKRKPGFSINLFQTSPLKPFRLSISAQKSKNVYSISVLCVPLGLVEVWVNSRSKMTK